LQTLRFSGCASKSTVSISRCQEFITAFNDLDAQTKIEFLEDDELVDKYEYCKGVVDTYESIYDDEDSGFGIVNEEDNLINNGFGGCHLKTFSQSHQMGKIIKFKYNRWVKGKTLKSFEAVGPCCFRIKNGKKEVTKLKRNQKEDNTDVRKWKILKNKKC